MITGCKGDPWKGWKLRRGESRWGIQASLWEILIAHMSRPIIHHSRQQPSSYLTIVHTMSKRCIERQVSMIGGIAGPMPAVETDICSWSHHGQSRNHSHNSLRFFLFFLCVKPNKTKQKQNKTKEIVRSLGTCWEATHELLHLYRHQSSHGDHLLDDRGGTRWWCDLLSAGLLCSRRFYSLIGPISTYQHWSALLQCVAYWVWPWLVVKGQILGSIGWWDNIFTQPAGGRLALR